MLPTQFDVILAGLARSSHVKDVHKTANIHAVFSMAVSSRHISKPVGLQSRPLFVDRPFRSLLCRAGLDG